MIQMRTKLVVADNSGAKIARCIKVLGGSNKMITKIGDKIIVSIQSVSPTSKIKKGEKAQAKFITVIRGAILDFLVDLRHGSFEETYFFKLSPGEQVYVPKGFAHGFLALENDTIIQYLVDNEYSPRDEISFDWKSNDTVKELVLAEVGTEENLLLSAKDAVGFEINRSAVETIDYSKI